ncbi:MAG: ABC transporter permease [Deltaproteobacteria bacterium]|nr:ABC transporter permease [Deltaproteobacteria bacterium]
MLRLLRLISYPQLRASWGRTLLVVGGIATGVSLIVAINIINTSVLANFQRTIDLMAGPAQLQVTLGVGEVGFPESLVEQVRGVEDVVASVPLVRGTIALAKDPDDALQLFGADLTAEEELQRYQIDPANRADILRRLADPRALLLTTAFAERHGIRVGDVVQVTTPRLESLTVAGLLEVHGLAAALDGALAVMDLPAAQMLLDKTGRVDQIDVVVAPDKSVTDVQKRVASVVPETLSVSRPEQRSANYERIVSAFQAMLTGLSALCLVVGVFIIYNTTSTGAVRRAAVMGELRVTGATEGVLFRLLMLEAALLGGIGSLLGVAYGIGLAHLLTGMVSDSMGVIFQLRFPVESLAIDLRHVAAILSLGIGTACFASYFAARRMSRVDPADIIRGRTRTESGHFDSRRLLLWWSAMIAASGIALYAQVRLKSFAWGNLGSNLWNASAVVLAVPLVAWSARLFSLLLPRAFGASGRMAAEGVFRSPMRTGLTVAAVAGVLTLAVTVSSLSVSFQRSVTSYYREGGFLPGDLVVSATTTEGGWLETPLPPEVVVGLSEVPGVAAAEAWRAIPGQVFRDERVALFGLGERFIDARRYGARWYREGDPAAAAAALRSGTGANVSSAMAERFDLHVGDALTLDTPTGPLTLPIVGVVRDYISDRGAVIVNRNVLTTRWLEPGVSRVHLFLTPNADPAAVRQAVTAHLGARYRLKIVTMPQVIRYLDDKVKEAFAFTDAIQLLVIIVTVAGIFDLLLARIVERQRELALWRVIGADDGTVRRTIVLESATIGGLGTLLGVPVGLITSWMWVAINYRYLLGYDLDFHVALSTVALSVGIVLLMTLATGYFAARYATQEPILQGIRAD